MKKEKKENESFWVVEEITEKNSKFNFIESETSENDKEKLYVGDVQLAKTSSIQRIE